MDYSIQHLKPFSYSMMGVPDQIQAPAALEASLWPNPNTNNQYVNGI